MRIASAMLELKYLRKQRPMIEAAFLVAVPSVAPTAFPRTYAINFIDIRELFCNPGMTAGTCDKNTELAASRSACISLHVGEGGSFLDRSFDFAFGFAFVEDSGRLFGCFFFGNPGIDNVREERGLIEARRTKCKVFVLAFLHDNSEPAVSVRLYSFPVFSCPGRFRLARVPWGEASKIGKAGSASLKRRHKSSTFNTSQERDSERI